MAGIRPDEGRVRNHLNASLMLVTALSPHIGYHHSAEIARYAYDRNLSLKEAALQLGYVTEAEFEEWVRPENMVGA